MSTLEKMLTRTVYPVISMRESFSRMFDICLSLAAIIFTLPIMLVVAALVRLTDGDGPVFFRQQRIKKNGEVFYLYKFRTMKHTTQDLSQLLSEEEYREYQTNFKLENDPRLIGAGAFLRKTSLDELPQLFNILLGDITFFGPRPITWTETLLYGEERDTLLSVSPGLTGYWQAYHRNTKYEDGSRQAVELYYVCNRSAKLNAKIFFKTIASVLVPTGK